MPNSAATRTPVRQSGNQRARTTGGGRTASSSRARSSAPKDLARTAGQKRTSGSTPATTTRRNRTRRALVAAVAGLCVAGIAIVGVGAWVWSSIGWLHSDSSTTALDLPARSVEASTPAPTPSKAPAAGDPGCPSGSDGPVSFGRDSGGTRGGVEVIKFFDFAYYVTRSGTAARTVVAPTGAVGDAARLQSFIDKVPAGTTHCLQITDRGRGLYAVTVAVTEPSKQPELVFQLINTADVGDRTVITSIAPDPAKGK